LWLLLLAPLAIWSRPGDIRAQTVASRPLVLEWPGSPAGVNPRPEDHALALFEEDEWNRALICPRSRSAVQPDDATKHRCEFRAPSTLELGGHTLVAAATRYSSEHDGMYSNQDDVVLLAGGKGSLGVMHTLVQWHESVVDCRTSTLMRRYRVVNLDRDRGTELCIETTREIGEGLFPVLDLGDAGLRWLPVASYRWVSAWRLSVNGDKLVRVPALDSRCPEGGYRLFVVTDLLDDPVAYRRGLQGPATEYAQCPLEPSNTCFEIDECTGAEVGPAGVAGIIQPRRIPWGAPARAVESGQIAGLRARVRLASSADDALPVVAAKPPLAIRYEVKNVSPQPLTLWHSGFWPNHRIRLFRPDGGEAPLTPHGRKMREAFAPRGKRGKNVEWIVEPGKVDDTEGRYDLTELFDLSRPGLYLLQVEYEEEVRLHSNVLPFWVQPRKVVELLARLNSWDRQECDVAERPTLYPGRTASGETNGFLGTHKELLSFAGVEVEWVWQVRTYRIREVKAPGEGQVPER